MRLIMDEEGKTTTPADQFYAEIQSWSWSESMVWFPYVGMDDYSELLLDGRFTLEQLKVIVAAWEKMSESVKGIDTTANAP